jgi:hypothetical protein
MTIAFALATGYLTVRLLRVALAPTLTAIVLQRPNYRSHYLPTAVGVLIALALLLVEAGRAVAGAAGVGTRAIPADRVALLLVAVAFAGLGLLDDLVGGRDEQGFGGHLRALRDGRLTTGGVKFLGGGAVALVACALAADHGIVGLARDALLVALAANLGNLFDRAPGRTLKVALAAYIAVAVVAGTTPAGVALAVSMGAAAALLGDDLREHVMLGDAGANVVGGVLGMACVLSVSPGVRGFVLLVLIGLNAASERVSFTAVINRVGVLRFLDQAGRRRPPSPAAGDGSGQQAPILGEQRPAAVVLPDGDETRALKGFGQTGEPPEPPRPDEHGADPLIAGGGDQRLGGDAALVDPEP